jgi:hypothetical protein
MFMKRKPRIYFPNFDGIFYSSMEKQFRKMGYELSNGETEADVIFHLRVNKIVEKEKRNYLLQMEPRCVDPSLYSSKQTEKFDATIPLSRYRAEMLNKTIWFNMPVKRRNINFANKREKKVIMMNAAKYSALSSSNYSIRREVLALDSARTKIVSLFGDHWNENRFLEFRRRLAACKVTPLRELNYYEAFSHFGRRYSQFGGKIDSGYDGLAGFRAAIVIENESDYLSEKIWLFLFQGVIPIYVGPNLRFDSNLLDFLEVSSPDPESILEKAISLGESARIEKMRAFKNFVNGREFTQYSPESCARNFLKMLKHHEMI